MPSSGLCRLLAWGAGGQGGLEHEGVSDGSSLLDAGVGTNWRRTWGQWQMKGQFSFIPKVSSSPVTPIGTGACPPSTAHCRSPSSFGGPGGCLWPTLESRALFLNTWTLWASPDTTSLSEAPRRAGRTAVAESRPTWPLAAWSVAKGQMQSTGAGFHLPRFPPAECVHVCVHACVHERGCMFVCVCARKTSPHGPLESQSHGDVTLGVWGRLLGPHNPESLGP